MENLTVKELKIKAKEMGIKGYSKMIKADLIKVIEKQIKLNSVTQILNQEIIELDKTYVRSASVCTGSVKRDDLVSIVTLDGEYYIVERKNYSNEGVFYGGYAIKINKDIYYLATMGYSKFTIDRYDLFGGIGENELDLIYNWLKNLTLEQKENVKFNPELTAIDTKNSKSAEMVAEMAQENEKVLDYGCGTGRNIKFIKSNADVSVDGCDIVEQLKKEHHRHEILRSEGSVIAESSKLPNEHYGIVLNSHVLNVIESDSVKKIVVADIFQKLKNGGKAVIEVRTKSDVEGAKTKEAFGDGWKIKKGSSFTYQEAITKEKMIKLVTEVGFKIDQHIYNNSKHIVVAVK